MSYVPQQIELARGTDFLLTVKMVPNGSIASYTLQFTVRLTVSGAAVITKTTTSGISITDNGSSIAPGTFTVAIARADTTGLAVGDYYYDIFRTDTGSYDQIANGRLTIRQNIGP